MDFFLFFYSKGNAGSSSSGRPVRQQLPDCLTGVLSPPRMEAGDRATEARRVEGLFSFFPKPISQPSRVANDCDNELFFLSFSFFPFFRGGQYHARGGCGIIKTSSTKM